MVPKTRHWRSYFEAILSFAAWMAGTIPAVTESVKPIQTHLIPLAA